MQISNRYEEIDELLAELAELDEEAELEAMLRGL